MLTKLIKHLFTPSQQTIFHLEDIKNLNNSDKWKTSTRFDTDNGVHEYLNVFDHKEIKNIYITDFEEDYEKGWVMKYKKSKNMKIKIYLDNLLDLDNLNKVAARLQNAGDTAQEILYQN